MQPYLLSPKERIRHWRDFRKTLPEKSDREQLIATSQYCHRFPILLNHYLNPDRPQDWLTPWELLYIGDFCSVSIPFMMEQTLIMSNEEKWKPERFQLLYVDDTELSAMFMILVIDAKYVLNYSLNEIINFDKIQKNCIIQNKYTSSKNHKHTLL